MQGERHRVGFLGPIGSYTHQVRSICLLSESVGLRKDRLKQVVRRDASAARVDTFQSPEILKFMEILPFPSQARQDTAISGHCLDLRPVEESLKTDHG